MTLTTQHKKILLGFTTAVLVLLFAYSGCSKLWQQQTFSTQLSTFIPYSTLAHITAFCVPVTELIVALGLLFDSTRMKALYASLFLLIVFTAYIVYLLLTAPYLPCSCGGVIAALTWRQHLLFNTVLAGINLLSLRLHRQLTTFPLPPPPSGQHK